MKSKRFLTKLLIFIVLCFFLKYFTINYLHKPEKKSIKVLRYVCDNERLCGGWGDRLKGIVSLYAWSLLTNRRFELKMNVPCNLPEFLLPNEIDWLPHNKQYNSTFNIIHFDTQSTLNKSWLNVKMIPSDKDLIEIRTNQNWIRYIEFNMTLYRKKLKKVGLNYRHFEYYSFFKQTYPKLFRLGPRLQTKYSYFLKQFNSANQKLICAQIRIGGRSEHVYQDKVFNFMNETKNFWNFINETFIKNLTNHNYRLFVTSDNKKVEQDAEKVFGKRIIKLKGENVHIDRTKKGKKSCDFFDKVFLDFHVFRHCDMVVISQSGFGLLSLLNRENPFENAYQYRDDLNGTKQFYKFN